MVDAFAEHWVVVKGVPDWLAQLMSVYWSTEPVHDAVGEPQVQLVQVRPSVSSRNSDLFAYSDPEGQS